MEILEDMDEGLEVVDPANLELDAGDLGHDYSRAVVDRCFTHALGPRALGPDQLFCPHPHVNVLHNHK